VADVRKNTLLGKEQPFPLASITKTFVSAALLRLNEEGRISLDDTIGKIFPRGT
jgi:D-alanyl-D-alanine carboxypeptidase